MPPKSRKKTLDAYIETIPVEPEPVAPVAADVEPLPPPPLAPAALTPPTVPPAKRARTRTTAKKEEKPTDHVIVQLPIGPEKIHQIIESGKNIPQVSSLDPLPYTSADHFTHLEDTVNEPEAPASMCRRVCFWCCHDIGAHKYGMPLMYDAQHQVFQQFGAFCSLECAAAHNFATHQGSDKVWEIHSWIQLLAKKLGVETPIRPAPSRFMLQLFGGPMTIDDFRKCHKSMHRAYVMNIPPMINVSSQTEVMNISYILQDKANGDPNDDQRAKLTRKKALMDSKRTLDAKMNLSYEPQPQAHPV